jgi:hypothetical protein
VSVASIALRVHARSPHLELVQQAAGVPRLQALVHGDEQRGLHAQLQVVWPDGRRSERQLDARTCREVDAVLAFLIVLTLDPSAAATPTTQRSAGARPAAGRPRELRAETGNASGASASAAPGTAAGAADATAIPESAPRAGTTADVTGNKTARAAEAATSLGTARSGAGGASGASGTAASRDAARADAGSASNAAGAAAATGTAVDASQAAAATQAREDTRSKSAPEPGRDSDSWLELDHLEWGLLAQLLLGAAPAAMPGLGLQLLVAVRGTGVWAPTLQLRATRQWLAGWTAAYGVADFQLDVVRLDACPLAAQLRPLTARACLEAGLGSLTAHGRATYDPHTRSRLWTDSGATLVLSAELGPSWQVGVNLGLVVPWRRDRFAFRPEEFHHVASLCWTGDLRIGVRFP